MMILLFKEYMPWLEIVKIKKVWSWKYLKFQDLIRISLYEGPIQDKLIRSEEVLK